MADTRRFWNLLSGLYSRQKIGDEAAYQIKLDKTQALLRPDMAVREIGCGTGSTAVIHAPHVASYEAVDFSPRMLAIARGRAADAGIRNLSFREAALDELDATGTFDAVLALSVLHLMADPEAAIARIGAMLKPGGLFISSTTCIGDGNKLLKILGPIPRALGLFPILTSFTKDALEDFVRNAGFEVIEVWQPREGAAVFMSARKPA